MKKKIKFNLLFVGLLGLIIFINNVYAKECPSYTYIAQQTYNGITGYCINPGMKGSLRTASSTQTPMILSGDILSNWAQTYGTEKKQQIAYRLIAMENGLAAKDDCFFNGHYTSDPDYNAVWQDWQKQTNKKVNRTSSSIYITGNVSKANGRFTANLDITGPSGQIINITTSGGNASLSTNTITGSGKVTVTGPLLTECTGDNNTVKVIATTNSATSSITPGSENPGTPPGNIPGVIYLYYPPKGNTQGFIVPGKYDEIKVLIPYKGTKPSGTPGSEETNYSSGSATYEINIEPPECEVNCDVNYSGDFICDGSGSQEEYIHETDNILSCITSGKYKNNCDGTSIQKNDGKLSGNPYCRVYCKEDIDFNLPGKVKVNSGTYFTLNSPFTKSDKISIEGKRTCYAGAPKNSTAKGIDKEKYIKDIKDLQNQIISKYNSYLKKKAEYEAYQDAKSNSSDVSCSGVCNKKNSSTDSGKYYQNKNEHKYKVYKLDDYDKNGSYLGSSPTEASANYSYGVTFANGSCNGDTYSCTKTETEDPGWTQSYYEDELSGVDGLYNNLIDAIEKYKACFDWENNYCSFNPKLTFSYEEPYNNQISGELSQASISKGSAGKDKGDYFEDVDSKYTGASQNKDERDQTYVKVSDTNLVTFKKQIDMIHTFVKKEAISTKTFNGYTDNVVCSYHPFGTIVIGNSCDSDSNAVKLNGDGYVFPVALEHKDNRQYNYNLEVSNIGAPGDDSTCKTTGLNRVVGEYCSKYEQTSSKMEAKYTCQYSSCPECQVKCVCPEGSTNCYPEDNVCKYDICDGCDVKCVGCLWNNGDSTFAYKQVSVSDVFPNSTDNKDVGYNWNTDSTINTNAQKAEATITDIERNAQKVYEKAEYSYTLTPTIMGKIRNYNEESNKDNQSQSARWANKYDIPKGGYNNDTLTCTNGIRCTSSFLDGLDDIVGKNNRTRNDQWEEYNGTSWK